MDFQLCIPPNLSEFHFQIAKDLTNSQIIKHKNAENDIISPLKIFLFFSKRNTRSYPFKDSDSTDRDKLKQTMKRERKEKWREGWKKKVLFSCIQKR